MLMQLNKLKILTTRNKFKLKIHTLNKKFSNPTFLVKIMKVRNYNQKSGSFKQV
jgi:hypothetical protein